MPTKLCMNEATEWADQSFQSIIRGCLPIGFFLGKYIIPSNIKKGLFKSNLSGEFFPARHFIENDDRLSRVNENNALFCDVLSGGGFAKLYHKLGMKVEFEILRSLSPATGFYLSAGKILNPEDEEEHRSERVIYNRVEIIVHARVY